MQSIFSETQGFTVTVKPDIERTISNFAGGGGATGEIQVFIEAFYQEVSCKPPFENSSNMMLGMTVLVIKFPEWLPNADYHSTYQAFKSGFIELGMKVAGASLRQATTVLNMEKASLIRETIAKLDATRDLAMKLLGYKAE